MKTFFNFCLFCRVKVLSLDINEGSVAVYNEIVYLGYRRQISATIREEKEKTIVKTTWCSNFNQDILIIYIPGEQKINVIKFSLHPEESGEIISIHFPCNGISKLFPLEDGNSIIIEDLNKNLSLIQIQNINEFSKITIHSFEIIKKSPQSFSYDICTQNNNHLFLSNASSFFIESDGIFYNNQSEIQLFQYCRSDFLKENEKLQLKNTFYLSKTFQFIHVFVQPDLGHQSPVILQIIDIQRKNYKIIEIPSDVKYLQLNRGSISNSIDFVPHIWISELPNGNIIIMEESGRVRVFEISSFHLENSLDEWKKLLGSSDSNQNNDDQLKLTIEYDGERDVGHPKEGKPTDGKEHHGGNTWQEGTGGVDTVSF